MMTYSNSASMQVEVTAYAILVFNEISSRGVSGCQVSNHLKESLLFSLSIEKRDILIILHGFGSLKGTRRCIHINTVTLDFLGEIIHSTKKQVGDQFPLHVEMSRN